MPTVPVNDAGAVWYYCDSGVPNGLSRYLTIVIIHGYAFHGAGFIPMFKHAAARNVRIIVANLRDYPGSTPYNRDELEGLSSPDVATFRTATRAQGMELAAFLSNVVAAENIPPYQATDKTGGVLFVSWSFGNVWTMSMLSNERYIPNDAVDTLWKYVRKIVLYEPPHFPLGATLPKEIYYPGYDPSIPPDQLGAAFGRWVSCFHTPVSELPHVDDLQTITQRPEMHRISDDPRWVPIVDQLPLEEHRTLIEPTVSQNSGRAMNNTDLTVWRENTDRALFDGDPNGGLNHLSVVIIWCDMSVPLAVWSISYVKDRFDQAQRDGTLARAHTFVKVEGANHFAHSTDPERFLDILLDNADL